MDLGLLLFIIFIIVKVLGKFSDIKDKLPKDWESKFPKDWEGNWPKEWQFPWEEGGDPEVEAGGTANQGRKAEVEVKAKGDYEAVRFEGPPPEDRKAEPTKVEGKDRVVPHPIINSDNLLNGIIMNEVLQPPKSRRRYS